MPAAQDWDRHPMLLVELRQRCVPVRPVLFPLHVPSTPQGGTAASVHIPVGSVTPAWTAVQVPAGPTGGLQVSQTPLQAVSQQTASLQVRPVMHWVLLLQVPPFGSRPHEPPTQVAGGVHWVSAVQMLVQDSAVVSHRPGAHEAVAGVTQVPAPSHLATGFCVPAVGQLAAAHWLLAGHFAH
jgi:hypothetical protein